MLINKCENTRLKLFNWNYKTINREDSFQIKSNYKLIEKN